MAAKISRLGDACSGTCSHISHTVPISVSGTITSVSVSTPLVEGAIVSTVGDTVTSSCGHTGIINSSPGKLIVENKKVTTIGATFSGIFSGSITGGCSKTET